MTGEDRPPSATLVGWVSERLRGSGGLVECEVRGASMGSGLPDGSMVRVRCDGAHDAPLGTVVALDLGGALTIHRLVHRGRSRRALGWVVTEGDANLTCDAPVPAEALLGRVDAVRAERGDWIPVDVAVPAPATRPRITALVRRVVCRATEFHPRAARAIKGAVVLAMTPFVWLRPYPESAVRHASVAHRPRS